MKAHLPTVVFLDPNNGIKTDGYVVEDSDSNKSVSVAITETAPTRAHAGCLPSPEASLRRATHPWA